MAKSAEVLEVMIKSHSQQLIGITSRVDANQKGIAGIDKNMELVLQEVRHLNNLFRDHLDLFKDHTAQDDRNNKRIEERFDQYDKRWARILGAAGVLFLILQHLVPYLIERVKAIF